MAAPMVLLLLLIDQPMTLFSSEGNTFQSATPPLKKC
jgi:hypothetical protein